MVRGAQRGWFSEGTRLQCGIRPLIDYLELLLGCLVAAMAEGWMQLDQTYTGGLEAQLR